MSERGAPQAAYDSINYGNFEANKRFLHDCGVLSRGARVLEIGCGRGAMLAHLVARGYDVVGIELNRTLITESRKLFGELPLLPMSGDSLQFDANSFDFVISFDVFEHIKDSDRHLTEVRRVLKNGGHYLLQTPNKWTNIPWEIVSARHLTSWRNEHCALHTPGQLARRLKKNGFEPFFLDVPIVNEYSLQKVRARMGAIGVTVFKWLNPDRWPRALRINNYADAMKV